MFLPRFQSPRRLTASPPPSLLPRPQTARAAAKSRSPRRALPASRHFAQYGTTNEQLADLAVATRDWAALNPKAYRREPLTREDVLNSSPIATPLNKLDCCLFTDGGGAVVVVSPDIAKTLDKPPVWLFRMPNRLKEKSNGGDFEFSADGGLADTDILEAAKSQIAEMADDYTDWVKDSITDLVNAHEEAQASFGQAEEQMKIAMEKINLLAHELRGQGGVFGYPLITEFGKSLYNCTGASARVTENLLEFVKAHIDGTTAVIKGSMKGDGARSARKCWRASKPQRRNIRGPGKSRLTHFNGEVWRFLSRRTFRIEAHQVSGKVTS